jgi:putative transport protein
MISMPTIIGDVLRQHPEIAFFLVLGLGYLFGKISFGGFSLGAVSGTLLAGVLVGQLNIKISGDVKQCFFMLFLFSIGFRCGPQFFRGLKKNGLSQAALAAIVAISGLLTAFVVAKLFHYDAGTAAGVIAGSMTESATIGTAGEAISNLPVSDENKKAMTSAIAVAFAVTYLIGVVGVAWFLSFLAPRIMGVDLAKECREYEEKMGVATDSRGLLSAYRRFEARAYAVTAESGLTGKPARDILPGLRVFVERVRRKGEIFNADGDTILQPGDVAALSGPRRELVNSVETVLAEVDDQDLLDVPADSVEVFVVGKAVVGRTLKDLASDPTARGIFLKRLTRNGVAMPLLPETTIENGDIVTIVGSEHNVKAVTDLIGYADRPRDVTDMVFVASGIVIGALIGLPTFSIGALEIGLSSSVGVLLGGLVWGWMRSIHPTFGRIPAPTLWIFESLGLTGFVAVVGLAAGPDFVRGIQQSGPSLVVAGLAAAILPHLIGVLVGRHVFKMHPGILLGVCAGAGTATPALAAIQETAKSPIPTLGYGISYAVGNVLLALWGSVIVALLK